MPLIKTLWGAIKQEILTTPLNTFAAVATAVSLIYGLTILIDDHYLPAKSYVTGANLTMTWRSDAAYEGDLQLTSISDIHVVKVSGTYHGFDIKGSIMSPTTFSVEGDCSVHAAPQLRLEFNRAPESVVLCIKTENQKGAVAAQAISLVRDRASITVDDPQALVNYKQEPQSFQKAPICANRWATVSNG